MSRALQLLPIATGLTVLAGCAELPPAPIITPVPRAAHDEQLVRSIARHRQLAAQYRQSGDLASAATQWQIVALLAPNDEAAKREVAAVESSIDKQVQDTLAAGTSSFRSGDIDRATDAMLKVLALDPDNPEAAKMLREVEKRRQSRIQASRVARLNAAAGQTPPKAPGAPATPIVSSSNGFDLELPLEIFKAGDTTAGLRDLHRFVDANPNDKAARQRIGNVVFERGRELEDKGQREQALMLYEQAVSLRGDAAPGWNARIQALRKALADGKQVQEKKR